MQMHPPAAPSLSRQHSYQQMAYPNSRAEPATSTPLPPSPGAATSMDLFEAADVSDGRVNVKRQRTSNENLTNGTTGAEETSGAGAAGGNGGNSKRMSRARSDSAPLGYSLGAGLNASWQGGTRPRSGSGMTGRNMGTGVSGVGGASRTNGGGSGNGTPLLSMPTLTSNSPGR